MGFIVVVFVIMVVFMILAMMMLVVRMVFMLLLMFMIMAVFVPMAVMLFLIMPMVMVVLLMIMLVAVFLSCFGATRVIPGFARYQVHAALRAAARFVFDYFRVHRADILNPGMKDRSVEIVG